jgi:hypothetical protein
VEFARHISIRPLSFVRRAGIAANLPERYGEHLGASPAIWTGLAPSTRNPKQIHQIVTELGHQPTPVTSTSTYRTVAPAGPVTGVRHVY